MAVKLRLQRVGRTNYTRFRLVAADSHSPRDGRCIETLGWYDPHNDKLSEQVDIARVDYWLSMGAQPSLTVKQIIKRVKEPQSAVEKTVAPEKSAEVAGE